MTEHAYNESRGSRKDCLRLAHCDYRLLEQLEAFRGIDSITSPEKRLQLGAPVSVRRRQAFTGLDAFPSGSTDSEDDSPQVEMESDCPLSRRDDSARALIQEQVANILHAVGSIQRQLGTFCDENSHSATSTDSSNVGKRLVKSAGSRRYSSQPLSGEALPVASDRGRAIGRSEFVEQNTPATQTAPARHVLCHQPLAMLGESAASDTLFDLHHALFRPTIPKWRETGAISSWISYVHPSTALLGEHLYVGGREVQNGGGNRAVVWRCPVRNSLASTDSRWKPVQLSPEIEASDCYGAFVYSEILHIVLLSSHRHSTCQTVEDGVTIWCKQPDELGQEAMKCIGHLPAFRWHFGLALCGNHVVMVGGWEISRPVGKVTAFHLKTHEWEEWPDLPEPLTGPVALTMKNGLVVVGGFLQNSQPNAKVLFLPFAKSPRTWQMNIVPDTLLGACGAAIFEGRLLVAGGQDASGHIGRSVSVLDEESATWLQLPNLLKARCSPVIAILDRRLLCIAGRTNTQVRLSVEELDLTNWSLS